MSNQTPPRNNFHHQNNSNIPPPPHNNSPFFEEFKRNKRGGSPFDLGDIRKQIENERKMFFDSADPFGGGFTRGGSPGPAGGPAGGGGVGGGGGAAGSPRMGRGGFPAFDSARSRFEDFPGATRHHPMFSTMRRPGWDEDPFMDNPFNRQRQNSGSSGGGSSTSTGEEHIIPIRIERGGGFTQQQQQPQQNQSGTPPQSQMKPSGKGKNLQQPQNGINPISPTPIPMRGPDGIHVNGINNDEEEQERPQSQGPQRSNTDEKVQKGLNIPNDGRNGRARSAPPESSPSPGPERKFVASMNIEPKVNAKEPQQPNQTQQQQVPPPPAPQTTQLGGNCTKEKTPPSPSPPAQAQQGESQAQNQATRSSIPIVVEGRGGGQVRAEGPQKASRPAPTTDPRESTPPPQPPKKSAHVPKDAMEKVADIVSEVRELDKGIDEFQGSSRKDKQYLWLDEMLTRNLIKLDVIETEGREDVRNARKECIKMIQGCISKLEGKAPLGGEQKMETEPSGGGENVSNTTNTSSSSSSSSQTPSSSSEAETQANQADATNQQVKASA